MEQPVRAFITLSTLAFALCACDQGRVLAERSFRVTQRLTVDGEPVTVSAVFRCQSVRTHDISGVASGVRINAMAMAKRLDDGRAVIVRMAGLQRTCDYATVERREEWESGHVFVSSVLRPGEPHIQPQVFLLDDADAPTEIEFYMSGYAYETPGTRVTLGSLTGEPFADGEAPEPDDPRDAVPWIDGLTWKDNPTRWAALMFKRTPPDVWRAHDAALAAKLEASTEPYKLTNDEVGVAGVRDIRYFYPAHVTLSDGGTAVFSTQEQRRDLGLLIEIPSSAWPFSAYYVDDLLVEDGDRNDVGRTSLFDPTSQEIISYTVVPWGFDHVAERDWFVWPEPEEG